MIIMLIGLSIDQIYD